MQQVAEYMAKHFQGKTVAISSGYCPECLKKGTTDVESLPTNPADRIKFWEKLFDSKRLDPFIVLNSFIPAVYANNPLSPEGKQRVVSQAHFNKTLLDLCTPGVKCPQGAHCDPTCIFCNCLVDKTLGKFCVTKSDPPFTVHQGCLSQCTYTPPGSGKRQQCKAMIPNVPRYFQDFQCGMCQVHAQHTRNPERAMELVRPSRRFEPPPPVATKVPIPALPYASAPAPPPAPKPKPPTQAQTKLTRLGENKYSHDIRNMLKTSPKAGASNPCTNPYTRPEVVFTPHAASGHRSKRKRLDDSP